jgi:hypothetical protein
VSSPFATPAQKAKDEKEGETDGDRETGKDAIESKGPQSSFGDILSKSEVGPKEEKAKVDLAEQQGKCRVLSFIAESETDILLKQLTPERKMKTRYIKFAVNSMSWMDRTHGESGGRGPSGSTWIRNVAVVPLD